MAATKDTKSAPKKAPAGPSYEEMIKDAILAHPEDSRTGLSRPLLKKWIHAKYAHTAALSDATFASHLARAIASGEAKKVFVLPKGPSGKVKLAPGAKPKPAKKKESKKEESKEKGAKAKKPAAAATKDARKKTTTKKSVDKKPAAPKKAAPKKAAGSTKK